MNRASIKEEGSNLRITVTNPQEKICTYFSTGSYQKKLVKKETFPTF